MALDKFDVIVAGGAVVGSRVAEHCAKAGLSVAVLEEHPEPGKYGRCTAIVSKRGLDSIGVDYSASVLNEVYGADVFAGRTKLSVRTRQVQAVVLNRFKFDAQCARQAQEAGASFFFNSRFKSLAPSSSGFEVTASNPADDSEKKYSCKVLVGADGANSTVARVAGFPEIAPKDFAMCYEAEYEGAAVEDTGKVDVILDSNSVTGFFAWAVPCSPGCVRIGLGTTRRHMIAEAKEAVLGLDQMKAYLRPPESKVAREFHALIPIRPRARTQKDNILLVGDAAGQAKASTGGGIVFGSRCAKVASDVIAAHLKSGKALLGYESAWRKKYGFTLGAHRAIRSVLDGLDNSALETGLAVGKSLGLGHALERFGDMDEIVRV